MQSFLIVGSDPKQREQKVRQVIDAYNIHAVDRIVVAEKNSIGIDRIRTLQQQIAYKPINGTRSAAWITDASLLTVTAQHALLKTLEEPPAHALIFLEANSQDDLLTTILSRCQIFYAPIRIRQLDQRQTQQLQQFWQKLLQTKDIERMAMIPTFGRERTEFDQWLTQQIIFLHSQLKTDHAIASVPQVARMLKNALRAQDLIARNVHPQLVLDQYLLLL